MPVTATGLSARISAPTSKRSRQITEKQTAFTMDATIYEIILGELAEMNCSLIEHFQDTFYENASFSLLSADGLYCNATTDEIGTCWPRSGTGRIVERPCPAYINGVKYNTTSKIFK
ncbi:hypothetical protein AMECASPLE_022682 [Ameca splendens]|uniref:G-protein coupled receptors family 2 profile 1 domain-containing protein n=1 Tax=Ameca splendens TaxID=208324 RepID=A0ABV0Z2R8_9TELE